MKFTPYWLDTSPPGPDRPTPSSAAMWTSPWSGRD